MNLDPQRRESLRAESFIRRSSAWDQASFLCKFYPFFTLPIFRRVQSNQLNDPKKLDYPPVEDECKLLGSQLLRKYKSCIEYGNSSHSLLRALLRLFWPQLLLMCSLQFIAFCILYPIQMISLGWLIEDFGLYLNSRDELEADSLYQSVIIDALIIVGSIWLFSLVDNPYYLVSAHLGLKCRVAASQMIYKKALKLEHSSYGLDDSSSEQPEDSHSIGRLVNLVSSDVKRFDELMPVFSSLFVAPLQAGITLALLASLYVGFYPTLASLVLVLIYLIVQTLLGRTSAKIRTRTASETDERVRLISEIIAAIRIIKMYVWLNPMERLVEQVRERELRLKKRSSILGALNFVLFFVAQRVITFVALIVFVQLGGSLSPKIVFVTLGLTNSMRLSLTLFLPWAVSVGAETLVSCQRIDHFLSLPEFVRSRPNYEVNLRAKPEKPADSSQSWSMVVKHVDAAWNDTQLLAGCVLKDLSFSLRPKELLIVLGPVGSGKSSVLMCLLGELPARSGSIKLNGRISFAPQNPWISNGTVRENILLGKLFDSIRYQEVIRVCELRDDLESLPMGDKTQVGERGVSLSGGQKARVNLARALYHQADIYLLDDPLSAVDAPVARHIFKEAIQLFLSDKTVILATHQLQFAHYADKVLLLGSGRSSQAAFGMPDEILSGRESDLGLNLSSQEGAENKSKMQRIAAPGSKSTGKIRPTNGKLTTLELAGQSARSRRELGSSQETNESSELQSRMSLSGAFVFYLRSFGSPLGLIILTLSAAASSLLTLLSDYSLSLWSDSIQNRSKIRQLESTSLIDWLGSNDLSLIYPISMLLLVLTSAIYAGLFSLLALRASRSIHTRLYRCVTGTCVAFFDFRSIGSILARFSSDIGYIDDFFPFKLITIVQIALFALLGPALISVLNPIYWVPSVVLIAGLLAFRICCFDTVILLEQFEARVRAPILSHLSNTLIGLTTIRAFRVEAQFAHQFESYQDDHSSVWFTLIGANRMLLITVDWLLWSFVVAIAALSLGPQFSFLTSASEIGFVFGVVLALPDPLRAGIRQLIEIGGPLRSLNRIKEFTQLEPEEEEPSKRQVISSHEQPAEIRFINVSLRYFPDEAPVLKDIDLNIEKGEKIGIVGRTGAGKSSLVAVLFRLHSFDGSIELDRVDTKRMSLSQLRSSISIIPQEPILFSTTLRKNLDPFDEHSDEQIWAALEAVRLRPFVESVSEKSDSSGLELRIHDGGTNLSVGQRQLICFARTILRRNKILLLDEATSNVDIDTDSFIQETIAREFSDCTILTIAHRLLTVADSDKIVVLDSGRVREFDEPHRLIQNKSSLLSEMIEASEVDIATQIRHKIEQSHMRRQTFASLASNDK